MPPCAIWWWGRDRCCPHVGIIRKKKDRGFIAEGFLQSAFISLCRPLSHLFMFFFFAFFLLISYLSAHELTMFCTWSWWCHRSLLQLIPAHVRRMKAANTPAQVASLLQGTSQNMRWRL